MFDKIIKWLITRLVPQGRWVHHKDKLWSGGGYTECSACGFGYSDAHYHEVDEFNFCPNCGVKMKGDQK